MKRLLLIVLLQLCGCNKKWMPFGSMNGTPFQQTVIGTGQSNMAKMDLNVFVQNVSGIQRQINIAVGGSSLDQWQRGTAYYNNLVSQLKANNVPVVLWWQGEAEGLGTVGTDPYTWGDRFKQTMLYARQDSGKNFIVIMVKIGLPSYGLLWDEVRSQQDQVSFCGLYKVNVDDMPRLDGVHYLSEQYKEIAQRLANVYNQINE